MTFKKTPLLLRLRVISTLIIVCATLHVYSLIYENTANEQIHAKEYTFQVESNLNNALQEIYKQQIEIGELLKQEDTLNLFDSVAASFLKSNKTITAIELAPQGIIRYIHPINDHYLIAGYNIINDESQYDNVIYSLKTGKPHFVGPIELRQGGQAIISRLPIFDDEGFVGFSIMLIDPDKLLLNSIPQTTQRAAVELSLSTEQNNNETCHQQALNTEEKSIFLNSCYKDNTYKYINITERATKWLVVYFGATLLALFLRKKLVTK